MARDMASCAPATRPTQKMPTSKRAPKPGFAGRVCLASSAKDGVASREACPSNHGSHTSGSPAEFRKVLLDFPLTPAIIDVVYHCVWNSGSCYLGRAEGLPAFSPEGALF